MKNKSKIAYVDDDINNLNHFKKMLSDNFEVDTYLRSGDFLKQLNVEDYDCYIFDIFMPLYDGFYLLEQVRGHDEKRNIPVFIVTSNANDEIRVNSYKTGAADFVDRLIKKDEMIVRIQSKIDLAKESANIIRIGNIRFDLKKMSCELEKKNLDLTLLEYKILTGLAQRHPQKTTKTELIEFIWGNSVINDNNLNTHLYNLRKKIVEWNYEISNHRTEGFWLSFK